jgi:hypothetical protein
MYSGLLIIKKKHYIGIPRDETKELDIKGIEGIKSDRPLWINRLQKDFVDDLRHNRNPTVSVAVLSCNFKLYFRDLCKLKNAYSPRDLSCTLFTSLV